jgi:SAM-dependent methyltransferase
MHAYIDVDRERFLDWLATCLAKTDLAGVREAVALFQREIQMLPVSAPAEVELSSIDPRPLLRQDILLEELEQIAESRTLRRAHHYLKRLRRSVLEVRTGGVNDINLNRWKEYDDLVTDSLWLVGRRDSSGAHGAWYWGNFVPQIPHQLLLRYTRAGDWVLDPFVGSGTTLIECRRLGRNGFGVELNPEVAERAREAVEREPNLSGVVTEVVVGDSTSLDFAAPLADHGIRKVQFALLHPPYHDIIQFNGGERDLSGAPTVEAFVARFSQVVTRTLALLEPGRHFAVVIGDKYQAGAWIPLGFYTMQAVMAQGCTLKSIIVKNFEQTRAKRAQQALWRYRALVGGFYVFKHEYIFLFQAQEA